MGYRVRNWLFMSWYSLPVWPRNHSLNRAKIYGGQRRGHVYSGREPSPCLPPCMAVVAEVWGIPQELALHCLAARFHVPAILYDYAYPAIFSSGQHKQNPNQEQFLHIYFKYTMYKTWIVKQEIWFKELNNWSFWGLVLIQLQTLKQSPETNTQTVSI